jgi:LysR family transcriptional activator of nhaA
VEWLNFRHLYAFWSVCRHGGFGKAAARIFVSQSTVSEQVAQLEDYLGETLLQRSTRSVRVTDRGAALLQYADAIFAQSHAINTVFRDKALTPTNIRIGMVGGISRNFIFRRITTHLQRTEHPQIEVVDGSFDELNALLKSFELDLIFSLDRPRQKDMVALSHQRVESSPMCMVGRPDRIARIRETRTTPEDAELYMFRHPFEGPPLAEVIAQQYVLDTRVPVITDDISLLRFLAMGGRGMSVVPQMGVQADLDAGRLDRIVLEGAQPVEVYATFLTKGVRRALVDAFLR